MWSTALDVVSSLLLLTGGWLTLSAVLALLRFPDLLSRMHAATKPQVLGLLMILTAGALQVDNPAHISGLLLVMAFQLLTAPVTAHIVGRAAYHDVPASRDDLVKDELDEDHPVLD